MDIILERDSWLTSKSVLNLIRCLVLGWFNKYKMVETSDSLILGY